jgi:LacI family transcriptional regulator, repressor for deo operon, udp, cdd, tsx, nupC, and nupG
MAKSDGKPGPAKSGAPTVNDIARVAKVSSATVSRTLANSKLISAQTRRRVMDAVRQLGYKGTAGLKAKNSRTVLALIPRLGSPFFTPFLDAATDLLAESGYELVVGDLRGSIRKERLHAEALRDGRYAGLMLFTGAIPDEDRTLLQLPIVLACNAIPGEADLPLFDIANRDAARQIVSYLISIGHRRIAHLRGPARNVEAQERYAGFMEAFEGAGLKPDPSLVWDGDFYFGSGRAAAGRFLACVERPTAVFAGNDQMAMGFITELKAAGVAAPDQVSVAGFDDIEFSSIFDPALTTMRQPKAEIGRLAALELLRRMSGTEDTFRPPQLRLDCELVIRNSTSVIRNITPQAKNSQTKGAMATRKRRPDSRPDPDPDGRRHRRRA